MAKVYLTQCLCKNRHCIAAMTWEESEFTVESAITALKDAVTTGIDNKALDPWCNLCHNTEFSYETDLTPFSSIQETRPFLREAEARALRNKQNFDILRN